MTFYIAHRSDGAIMLVDSRNAAGMRKALATQGYSVDHVPEDVLQIARPQMFMPESARGTNESRDRISAAARTFPTLAHVLAIINKEAVAMSTDQPTLHSVDIVANMKARVEAAKDVETGADEIAGIQSKTPADMLLVTNMRQRFNAVRSASDNMREPE